MEIAIAFVIPALVVPLLAGAETVACLLAIAAFAVLVLGVL